MRRIYLKLKYFCNNKENSTVGRVNFWAKKSHRHSERSEESPGRKRKRQEMRGVRSEVGSEDGVKNGKIVGVGMR